MKTIGNLIWLVFGGIVIAIEYFIASLVLMITIIGIPFGLQTMKLGVLALWPFGKDIKTIPSNSGCLMVLMNIIWILFGGIWISLSHVVFGLFLLLTLIGAPFGFQHFKLAALALTPFGKEIYQKV